MEKITRFGVSIDPILLRNYDQLIKTEGYSNRSEAIRDLIRNTIVKNKITNPQQEAIGSLTIIYDHHSSNLTTRLLEIQHHHHTDILATTHIHIDHYNCLEILVLKGKVGSIQKLADTIKSLKGIKHGDMVITDATI
jgi:CopG family nickel-responsive transcriptional regulator